MWTDELTQHLTKTKQNKTKQNKTKQNKKQLTENLFLYHLKV